LLAIWPATFSNVAKLTPNVSCQLRCSCGSPAATAAASPGFCGVPALSIAALPRPRPRELPRADPLPLPLPSSPAGAAAAAAARIAALPDTAAPRPRACPTPASSAGLLLLLLLLLDAAGPLNGSVIRSMSAASCSAAQATACGGVRTHSAVSK